MGIQAPLDSPAESSTCIISSSGSSRATDFIPWCPTMPPRDVQNSLERERRWVDVPVDIGTAVRVGIEAVMAEKR